MTSGIKYKWLLLTVIWAGCFLLCYLNNNTINSILDNREKKEILQKDAAFWKQNSENITVVIEKEKLLTHEIDSLKLGLVFLDDTFNRFRADYDLTELKVEMDARLSQNNSMPVKISFNCRLKNGLSAIGKIQEKYAFLPFRQVKVNQDGTDNRVRFDIQLDYKYRINAALQNG